jgi:hypothetical protein
VLLLGLEEIKHAIEVEAKKQKKKKKKKKAHSQSFAAITLYFQKFSSTQNKALCAGKQ